MLTVDIQKTLPEFTLKVSFAADQGILAILGQSGSGKTMTLRCIAGLVTPDSGRIKLDDRVFFDAQQKVNLRPQQRNVGFVFQNYALFPNMTCHDNIAFGMREKEKMEIDGRVEELMNRLRISKLAARYPRQLSGGQQQRVALARALATSPDILLLDEPFSALDTMIRNNLQALLLEIRQFYQGYILLVTHDLAEAYRLSSRIAVYEAGRLLQLGPKEEILTAPANATVASMTGMKNIWKGTVVCCDGDHVELELQETGLRLQATGSVLQLQTGQSVDVGVRSEDLRLLREPALDALPGTISRVAQEVVSSTVFFEPDTAKGRLLLEVTALRNEIPAATGEHCWLQIPRDRLVIMPSE